MLKLKFKPSAKRKNVNYTTGVLLNLKGNSKLAIILFQNKNYSESIK
jgi:hypothetical protein